MLDFFFTFVTTRGKRLLVLVLFPRMWIKCVPGLKVIDFQSRMEVKTGAGTDWPRVFNSAGNAPQQRLKFDNHAEGMML